MSSLDRTFRRALTAVATASLVTVSLASIGTPVQAAASRAVFTQASPIHLGGDVGFGSPTNVPIPESGQLDPYPLELEIPPAAAIQDISVEVWLEHDRPADLELVLVGPSGHQVVLLNGAGGETPASTLMSFTADAETVLAPGDPLPSDDVRPASFGDLDLPGFPQTPSTDLSGFDGTLAGGTWRLYVYDAAAGAGGQLHEWGIHLDLVTTPYPSELAVAGIGDVSDVNVTFDGLTAEAPDDGNFLLVGPQGQRAMLMSDAGGHADPVTGLDLTFDDEAAAMIPSNRIDLTGSGTYQLSDYVADDEFVGLGRLVGVPSSLTVFDGTDPNGTWRLYAVDDQADGGLVSIEGWSLDIETDDLTAPVGTLAVAGGSARAARATVDLAVTATDPGPEGVRHPADAVQQRRHHVVGLPAVRRHGGLDPRAGPGRLPHRVRPVPRRTGQSLRRLLRRHHPRHEGAPRDQGQARSPPLRGQARSPRSRSSPPRPSSATA